MGAQCSSGDVSDAISLQWAVSVMNLLVNVVLRECTGSHKAAANCFGDQWPYLGQDLDSLLPEKQT